MPTMIIQQAQYSNRSNCFSSYKGRRKTADWPIWGKEDMPVERRYDRYASWVCQPACNDIITTGFKVWIKPRN